jgi:acetyl-CoA C-acetyltransferase
MRPVGIVGIGTTSFGNLSAYKLTEILAWSACEAMEDAGVKKGDIQQVIVGNMAAGMFNHQSGVESAMVSLLNLEPAMAELVGNGPASGSSAVKLGWATIASGLADVVLVTAGEQMRGVSGWEATDVVATLTHPDAEYPYGVTLPALGGMFLRAYMEKYGLTGRQLAALAVQAHANSTKNRWAHTQTKADLDALTTSPDAAVINPMVAEPLRFSEACPVSDGSASLVLCALDQAKRFKREPIVIRGVGSATDTHCVHNRDDLLELKAVRLSAERALKMAGLGVKDIDIAQLHDAFTILELVLAEEVGFFERGKAIDAWLRGDTKPEGKLPINTDGGLKGRGHPVGGTGVSQIYELVKQLRREAEEGRQVKKDAKVGMAVNFGGFGNNVVCTVVAKQ